MTKKTQDTYKTVAISAVWVSTAVASFSLGFWTLGMAGIAFLATLAIVEG